MGYYITAINSHDHRVSRGVGDLRFDAGSISLNLVATVGRRFGARIDRLDSSEPLHNWLRAVGLAASGTLDDDDLARVRVLREHLDELFRSAFAGRPPATAALRHVNAAAAAAIPQLRRTNSGVALAPPPSGRTLDPLLALIAADAIRVLAGRDRLDLRRCEADDCRMLYLAHGRPERRWCSSQRCGNRSRVAAHRARAAGLDRR
jgi:predicted RNA-binding Zn ribbon-like protein